MAPVPSRAVRVTPEGACSLLYLPTTSLPTSCHISVALALGYDSMESLPVPSAVVASLLPSLTVPGTQDTLSDTLSRLGCSIDSGASREFLSISCECPSSSAPAALATLTHALEHAGAAPLGQGVVDEASAAVCHMAGSMAYQGRECARELALGHLLQHSDPKAPPQPLPWALGPLSDVYLGSRCVSAYAVTDSVRRAAGGASYVVSGPASVKAEMEETFRHPALDTDAMDPFQHQRPLPALSPPDHAPGVVSMGYGVIGQEGMCGTQPTVDRSQLDIDLSDPFRTRISEQLALANSTKDDLDRCNAENVGKLTQIWEQLGYSNQKIRAMSDLATRITSSGVAKVEPREKADVISLLRNATMEADKRRAKAQSIISQLKALWTEFGQHAEAVQAQEEFQHKFAANPLSDSTLKAMHDLLSEWQEKK
ncbi:hypothetical protein KIPB_001286 [Kipferlia bialata]|uniref:Uncharacterized protein n=1 Tax=Kipferlia bialata TaxID=797122 RepID=A0A9K3CQ25_9EUKA|nr:hypothetical protein KIPB_001286 [Kipferlia bialata]|eukprot:g1286.t1